MAKGIPFCWNECHGDGPSRSHACLVLSGWSHLAWAKEVKWILLFIKLIHLLQRCSLIRHSVYERAKLQRMLFCFCRPKGTRFPEAALCWQWSKQ